MELALTQCAQSAKKSKKSFFCAQYQRIVVRRGKNRATVAVAHSMLIAIYHVLKGAAFIDLGAEYYMKFNKENPHERPLATVNETVRRWQYLNYGRSSILFGT
jgi:hypothetical protein